MPFGTQVQVTNLANGRSASFRINDRGPFIDGRIIDLSRRGAEQLGFRQAGIAEVRVQEMSAKRRAAPTRQSPPRAAPYQASLTRALNQSLSDII